MVPATRGCPAARAHGRPRGGDEPRPAAPAIRPAAHRRPARGGVPPRHHRPRHAAWFERRAIAGIREVAAGGAGGAGRRPPADVSGPSGPRPGHCRRHGPRVSSPVMPKTQLMISVAGVRGVVGDSLDPAVVARFSAAFARVLPGEGPVVIGRDARVTGPMVRLAACAGLNAAGRDVIDIGLATTPTTQLAVEHLGAAGGVILTASHNPAPWNALKFLSAAGEFLGSAQGSEVRKRFETDRDLWARWDAVGSVREESGALAWHLERVLGLPHVDVPAIRGRALHGVVDGCASVGGIALPALLEALGARVTRLDCEPNGQFTRELEPLPEHLGALSRAELRE